MCGIVGLIDLKKELSEQCLRQTVDAMRDSLTHRGPDDADTHIDEPAGCALAHRRLSIIDLSPCGRQPMTGEGTKVYVTYNGEIYNFQELRQDLEAQGCRFRGHSDTEILPFLFRDLDPLPLQKLNGMFAFGVWHEERRELLLARDPFGKKPLYIYEDDRFFAFASEMTAFQHIPGFHKEVDQDGLAEYLLISYVSAPRSIYKNVRMLEPGTFQRLSFANDQPKIVDEGRYFEFAPAGPEKKGNIDPRFAKETLRELLIKAVERRMISDVPLGALLSGGVDSAIIVAIVRKELGRDLDTFSIGFADSAESEHHEAREIADFLGTNHHDELLQPHAVDLVHHVAKQLDHPNGDSSCLPTYLLSEFAKKNVTVVLSGDGGDEMFGGYGRYRDTLNEWASPDLMRQVHGFKDPAKVQPADLYMSLRWLIWLPDTVDKLMGGIPEKTTQLLEHWRQCLNGSSNPIMHRMRQVDAKYYMPGAVLPKVDRMSMQHSLEVRSPLLDRELAQFAATLSQEECWIPPGGTKHILKDLASDYLPTGWMNRPKKGFGLPANAWSMDNLIALAHEVLLDNDAKIGGLLDKKALKNLIKQQSSPQTFSIYQIWPLLVLELWLKEQSQHP